MNVRAILARYKLPFTRFLHTTHGIENLTFLVWSQILMYMIRVSSLQNFLGRVKAFIVELHDSLPKGLSHFDFDIENILTKHDGVTAILDFGDMECMPLVVCLGYTLWDVLFEKGGSPEMVTRYVQTYQGVRQLNEVNKRYYERSCSFVTM